MVTDDTVSSVRIAFVMLVAAMPIIACGSDPHLDVVVVRPAEVKYRAEITQTVISIYEPSESTPVTCEQVEFSDIDDQQLLGALVAEQTIDDTAGVTGTLSGISRLGPKVIVARLFSSDHRLIAAGCAEQDEIADTTKVTVTTVVASIVAFDGLDAPSRDDPYGKLVTVLDPLGDSLVNFPVRWRVFGAAGTEPARTKNVTQLADNVWESSQPSCTRSDGTVDIHPVEPKTVSGFAAKLRVSWQSTPPELFSGFVRPNFAVRPLGVASGRRCAVRTAGARQLVCLTNANEVSRFELVVGPDNTPSLKLVDTKTALGAIGVVAVDDAGKQEVYAISSQGSWSKLYGTRNVGTGACPGACVVDDFVVLPACGGDAAKLVLHTRGTASPILEMDLFGTAAATPFNLGTIDVGVDPVLDNAGCMTQVDSTGAVSVLGVVALDFVRASGSTNGRAELSTTCGAAGVHCSVPLPFPEAGIGFITTAAGEHQMIGTSFDVLGAELTSWVLRPADGSFHLIERQHITAAAPPTQIVVGNFDSDADADLVWGLAGARNSTFQVSYAKTVGAQRLSALATVLVDASDLIAADLDGDGIDEMIGVGPNGVAVIPIGVPGAKPANFTFDDPTCQ